MSLLLIPRPQNLSAPIVMSTLSLSEAASYMGHLDASIALDKAGGMINLKMDKAGGMINLKILRTVPDGHFEQFSLPVLPADVGTADNLARMERKIADHLAVSRTPGASGKRAVFVDLRTGELAIGTTVVFNERNAAQGVSDASLGHKVEFVADLIGMVDMNAPAPPAATLTLCVDGPEAERVLAGIRVKTNGEEMSLGDLIAAAKAGDDLNSRL